MISETLASGLEQYKIGQKVRALRQAKKLGLVQLGAHTGLSPALLSKIERGQLIPTLPTLLRIALVFGVGLEHFFVEGADKPAVAVVRKTERLQLPDKAGAPQPAYIFESVDFPVTDRKMQAYYAEFPPQSKISEPHRHEGAEFIYVIKGQLGVDVDGNEVTLDEGDSMYFESDAPHSYQRKSRTACAAIVVVAGE